RLVHRGDDSRAGGVGGGGRGSVVRDRNTAQTGGAGRDGGGPGRSIVSLGQVAERERRGRLVDGQRAGGVGGRVERIVQRRDNGVAAGVCGRGGRSTEGDRDAAQTGGGGRDDDRFGRSVVALRQVAERDRRRPLDRQRAGGVGSRVIRIVERGYNGVAGDVGGRGCRSIVSDRDAAQAGGGGGDVGGLGRSVVALRQVAERDRRRRLVDGQRAGGVGSRVVRVIQRGHNGVAAGAGGRSGRSVVSDRNAAQTGRVGRDRDGLRRSIVALRQVAERDRRRTLADGQRAGGVGSGVVPIVQRGHNSVAAGVGGRRCRSVV